MSMNLPSIGSAQTPYGLASIHVGRYPVSGAPSAESPVSVTLTVFVVAAASHVPT